MTVAVTGASGHIGNTLVRALVAAGRPVRAVLHSSGHGHDESLADLAVERVRADVRDAGAIGRALDGAEVVFHLAAVISLHERDRPIMEEVNVAGTRNVARACEQVGVKRLVHFSSIHAFSPEPHDAPVDEQRALATTTPGVPAYDRTKALGLEAVEESVARGLDAVIVHPTGVIGPHDFRPSEMGKVLLRMKRRTLPALVEGGFNFVDVRDVVAGALAAETRGGRGERYLLGGHWIAIRELGRVVERVTGVRAPRLVSPMWLARGTLPFVELYARLTDTRPPYNFASLHALRTHRDVAIDKARRALGYAPRPFEETLRDTFAWFEEHGVEP